jgi:hypothetical protein
MIGFGEVTVRHNGRAARLTMMDTSGEFQNLPLVPEAWKHLKRVGLGTEDTVLFREHHGEYCVKMQLAHKLLLGTSVDLTLLQQQYGNILLALVPPLPVTTITFPILAVDDWTKKMERMNSFLAKGALPSLVQEALGNNVSIQSRGNIHGTN